MVPTDPQVIIVIVMIFDHESDNYQELEKMDRKKLHENAKKFFLVMRE